MWWSTVLKGAIDVIWLVFLLLLFRYFWLKRKDLLDARSWLKVKGHITSCEWTTVGHSVWPKIEYEYEVYNKTLLGEYLFLDTLHNSPSSKYSRNIAYKVSMAFKNNSEIDVYYNPNNPEQSALDVTMPKKLSFILILIGTLLLSHIVLIVWGCLHYYH
ncbi:DUF3592 domain-containing protein [Legionella waltersii]|uniref:DUF3592 domain-containing protein n=1 Tax=Legionella waltersii TaxID=66969 RepID=A0A0W1A5L9_9GAMM|nr:DUF3592 domain-containing protein [Legionella waltersii]KTD76628.1 hypothetical protein Lwal_2350 [Legionella waltersii]SNU94688.1 Protein of uncharacterised function (DUF3592) [Legionella waltersii]